MSCTLFHLGSLEVFFCSLAMVILRIQFTVDYITKVKLSHICQTLSHFEKGLGFDRLTVIKYQLSSGMYVAKITDTELTPSLATLG